MCWCPFVKCSDGHAARLLCIYSADIYKYKSSKLTSSRFLSLTVLWLKGITFGCNEPRKHNVISVLQENAYNVLIFARAPRTTICGQRIMVSIYGIVLFVWTATTTTTNILQFISYIELFANRGAFTTSSSTIVQQYHREKNA